MTAKMPTIIVVPAIWLEPAILASYDKAHAIWKIPTPIHLLLLLTVVALSSTDDHQIFS